MANTIHTCTCGASYTARQWRALRLVGHQAAPATEDEPALYLELRDCASCGSTRAVDAHQAERSDIVESMRDSLAAWAGFPGGREL